MCEGNSTIGLFDNHTHLDLVSGEMGVSVDAVLQDARDAGVLGVVTVGCDVESSLHRLRLQANIPVCALLLQFTQERYTSITKSRSANRSTSTMEMELQFRSSTHL